jgi:hypothetical protein
MYTSSKLKSVGLLLKYKFNNETDPNRSYNNVVDHNSMEVQGLV